MKIKPIKAYKASDGTCWENLADFQRAELVHIIGGESKPDAILDLIVASADRVGEVFGIKERKPRERKSGKKERKALGRGVEQPATEAA